ncbi:putative transmembrane protein [Toxoplasma gondii VAND]|uniref:Putative transmembrane protein n=1 Tax=Toxoplasma gondii VAND TaxID=933077 RepID=A0A086PWS4_TOXGO|nr:putative transmembrane protein [Toxoplasma gondii VAND]
MTFLVVKKTLWLRRAPAAFRGIRASVIWPLFFRASSLLLATEVLHTLHQVAVCLIVFGGSATIGFSSLGDSTKKLTFPFSGKMKRSKKAAKLRVRRGTESRGTRAFYYGSALPQRRDLSPAHFLAKDFQRGVTLKFAKQLQKSMKKTLAPILCREGSAYSRGFAGLGECSRKKSY